jgi:hypothetical protein
MEFSPTFSIEDLKHVAIFNDAEKNNVFNSAQILENGKNNIVLSDLYSAFNLYKKKNASQVAYANSESNKGRKCNAGKITEIFNNNDEWRGASPSEFLKQADGEIDLTDYLKQKEKMRGVSDGLQEYLQRARPGRKRSFSDKDGDFIHERSWDISPFATTQRVENLNIPKLTIVCDISFNSGVSSSFIQKHCMLVWVIVDLFEQAGILCSVYSSHTNEGLANGFGRSQFLYELKKHDSYVSANSIARGMSAAFFRRLCFLQMINLCAFKEKDCSYGLGRPLNMHLPFFKDGILFMRGDDTEELMSLDPEQASQRLLIKMQSGLTEMGLEGNI